MKSILAVLSLASVLACDPPPQGPQDVSYENGYAQSGPRQTTYQNGYAQQGSGPPGATATATATAPGAVTYSPVTAPADTTQAPATTATAVTAAPPVEIQTTPVPLGVQPLPLPSTTSTAATTTPPATQSKMATPGLGAFQCTSDAQCLLGRCNTQFNKCAYPCKSTENDCKAGNVCTASGVCLPKGAAGVKM